MPLTFFVDSSSLRQAAKYNSIERMQAIVELSREGRIVSANNIFLEASGYALEELLGQHYRFLLPRHGRPVSDELSDAEPRITHFKLLGKDSRELWLHGAFSPFRDGSGQSLGTIMSGVVITGERLHSLEADGKIRAIDRAQAIIEFQLDGSVITANDNFLKVMGYALSEIQGRHHRLFVDTREAEQAAYQAFWDRLRAGHSEVAEYRRIAKGGREVWILASYNPILNEQGKPFKIVKFATDITEQKLIAAANGCKLDAIDKSQAVIEFRMDGTIVSANQNFLNAVGYTLDEIKGRHHSMFVAPEERDTAAYTEFWTKLNQGEFQMAEYRRIGKGGREIWIQASYNPILDLNGQPCRVIKYATDTTALAVGRMKAARARSLIDSVAAGSEEMSASIREISETMVKSRETANGAAEKVEAADIQAQRLNQAAIAMGGIVDLIASITSQINLLALNATIESARAGEAGRGFAVVATEVKNLASQAKQATEKISTEIEGLNDVSGDVVSALSTIRGAIAAVTEFVGSTAAAVEEQTAVTYDMSVNMQKAAAELA